MAKKSMIAREKRRTDAANRLQAKRAALKAKIIDPEVKVLLSSGYSIDGQATEILKRGCNGFIQKPFNLKNLSRKIREVLNKSA